jgi:hypothetical protein
MVSSKARNVKDTQQYESFYNNMPASGLGKTGTLMSAVGHKSSAAGRIQALRKRQESIQKEEIYDDSESTEAQAHIISDHELPITEHVLQSPE